MRTITRKKPITFNEFRVLVKDGEKGDLIEGKIYMASPDNTDATELLTWLIRLLGDFIDLLDLGQLYHSRVAFWLNEINAPEPDLAFVSKRRLGKVQRGRVKGPPDLAREIVSPESVERDYEKKRLQYENAGVREYWIIDETTEAVTLLRLDSTGKFREIRPVKGVLRSRVLTGFWLRPEWLWQKPLPKKADVLNEILPTK